MGQIGRGGTQDKVLRPCDRVLQASSAVEREFGPACISAKLVLEWRCRVRLWKRHRRSHSTDTRRIIAGCSETESLRTLRRGGKARQTCKSK